MRDDSHSLFSWGGALGRRPARKAHPTRLELEAMEDRLVPAMLDLTTVGSSGAFHGALFQQAAPQPDGSGVIHAFLRIQSHTDTVEQGYNTDTRPLTLDQKKDLTFTRALLASDIPQVNVGGVVYSEFILDINQNQASPLLSLDALRLFVGNAPNLTLDSTSSNLLSSQGQSAPVYDMGSDSTGNANWVMLNSALNPGSGRGNMYLLVPSQLLQSAGNPFVYLYSKFGINAAANGGFEQWATTSVVGSSLSGFVYTDVNSTGQLAANDTPEANVTVTLTGTDVSGKTVFVQTTTDSSGFYAFDGLNAGSYAVTETPPTGYAADGVLVGSQGGSASVALAQVFNINLQANTNGINNDFLNVLKPLAGS
jgi:hypothetical protein